MNTAIAIIHSAVVRFCATNHLLSEMHHIVFDIFLSTTVYGFRNHFQTLETMESSKIKDWDLILKEAERAYQQMENEGYWLSEWQIYNLVALFVLVTDETGALESRAIVTLWIERAMLQHFRNILSVQIYVASVEDSLTTFEGRVKIHVYTFKLISWVW